MLYTTYYVKARMTGNLCNLANLPVTPLTCQLVCQFRQLVMIGQRYVIVCICNVIFATKWWLMGLQVTVFISQKVCPVRCSVCVVSSVSLVSETTEIPLTAVQPQGDFEFLWLYHSMLISRDADGVVRDHLRHLRGADGVRDVPPSLRASLRARGVKGGTCRSCRQFRGA